MDNNTADFSAFGLRELAMAGELLMAYAQEAKQVEGLELNDGLKIEFNPTSGSVFFVDDDLNVAMLNSDGYVENWLSCPECGDENFASEFKTIKAKGKDMQDFRVCTNGHRF